MKSIYNLFNRKSSRLVILCSLVCLCLVSVAEVLSEEHCYVEQKIVYMQKRSHELRVSLKDQKHKFVKELQVAKVRRILDNYENGYTAEEKQTIIETIINVSEEYQINPLFITAVIETESHFANSARSYMGARGLMQVMPHTGREIAQKIGIRWQGLRTLHNPTSNIRIGTYYLATLLKRYSDPAKALIAYNQGPSSLNYSLRRGYKLPRRYERKVMQAFDKHTRLLPLFA